MPEKNIIKKPARHEKYAIIGRTIYRSITNFWYALL